MSWRRFMVMVRCLSQQSATVHRLQSTEFLGQKQQPNLVETPKAAEHAFQALFKK